MLANSTGNIVDSMPTYGLNIPQLLVAANKYHWELFNHPSSGKTLTVRGIWAIPELSQTLASTQPCARFELFRTTAVASGGTASAAFESSSTILANFFRLDSNDASLSSHISCITQATSITTGTFLYPWYVDSQATTGSGSSGALAVLRNAISVLQQNNNAIPQREFGKELVVRTSTGVACRQGTVASAGSVGWLIEFTVDP